MEIWLINVIGSVAGLAITVAVIVVAVQRTRREPRRLSNAYWILGAILLGIQTAATFGAPGAGLVLVLSGVIILLAPVLVSGLAIFCLLNGVVMVRRESLSTGNVLSLGLGLAMLALVVGTIPVLLSPVPWLIVLWLGLLATAGYLGFQFASFVGYSLFYPRLVRRRTASWLVVLGSGLRADGTVPPLLASRVEVGVAETRRRGIGLLVLSGGKGDDEIRPEAAAMAEHAIALGADPTTIRVEDRSRSTEENLRHTAELVAAERVLPAPIPLTANPPSTNPPSANPPRPVPPTPNPPGRTAPPSPVAVSPSTGPAEGLIVTSNYHVLRAAMLARRLGIAAQAYGAPTAGYFWPSAMIREFIAVLAAHRIAHLIMIALITAPVVGLGLVVVS